MKKTITILLAITMLAALTACKTESYSTSTTDISYSATTDGETTEKEISTEVTTGASAGQTDDIETEGNQYDGPTYDWNYHVSDDGTLILYGPETDSDWWRMLSFDDSDTMAYVADELDENSIYYVEIEPTIQSGQGRAIMGHFTSDSSEKAVDFSFVDVDVVDGKVDSVTNSGFVKDLSELQ